jgi:hypothetical protein
MHMRNTFGTMFQHLGRRLWPHRSGRQFDPTGLHLDTYSVEQLQEELEQLTIRVLQKAGVNPACVTITIEHGGTARDGRPLLRSMISLTQWDADCALRLLLGVAHIERALRRALGTSWLSETAHFGGVWVHPSSEVLESSSGPRQLAAALKTLQKSRGDESIWSGSSAFGSSLRKPSQS